MAGNYLRRNHITGYAIAIMEYRRAYQMLGRPPQHKTADCHKDRPHYARGMCRGCYVAWHRLRHGSGSLPAGWRAAYLCQILAKQHGRCAVCETQPAPDALDRMVLDHDHALHRVRGVLCFRCSLMLGFIDRTPSHVLRRMLAYSSGVAFEQLPKDEGRGLGTTSLASREGGEL